MRADHEQQRQALIARCEAMLERMQEYEDDLNHWNSIRDPSEPALVFDMEIQRAGVKRQLKGLIEHGKQGRK